jgi:carbon-monoxide dehydrogenase medium subunit
MSEIQYQTAKTVKEACKFMLAAKGKGYILAGGTDLLVQMKSGARAPGVIVDVKKIPEMTTIVEKKGSFTIGAATPAAVIGEHKKLKKTWPGVVEAINLIGSTQVQGRASAGGNLCNASPAARCRAQRASARYRSRSSAPARARPRSSRARSSSASPCRRGRRTRATPICA